MSLCGVSKPCLTSNVLPLRRLLTQLCVVFIDIRSVQPLFNRKLIHPHFGYNENKEGENENEKEGEIEKKRERKRERMWEKKKESVRKSPLLPLSQYYKYQLHTHLIPKSHYDTSHQPNHLLVLWSHFSNIQLFLSVSQIFDRPRPY